MITELEAYDEAVAWMKLHEPYVDHLLASDDICTMVALIKAYLIGYLNGQNHPQKFD
jgi:hypothetical protein